MPKSVPVTIMDTLLDAVAASTRQDVVSDAGTPADLTNSLANVTMAGGDFSKATGDAGAGSRKLTIATKPGVAVGASGTPNHVVLSLGGTINMVTTCTGPDLTNGSTVDFSEWEYELGVPA